MSTQDEWEPPSSWLCVYDVGDQVTYVCAEEANRLDAAIAGYLDSGKTRDELLSLRMVEGEDYRVPLSNIRAFFLSTPEFRKRNAITLKFQKEENKQVRAELGLPYKEDDD